MAFQAQIHDFAGILDDLLRRLFAVESWLPVTNQIPIQDVDPSIQSLLRSLDWKAFQFRGDHPITRSQGKSRGTIPIPVIKMLI
jgi:hypothetical protein